jgi:hypothetical protein
MASSPSPPQEERVGERRPFIRVLPETFDRTRVELRLVFAAGLTYLGRISE